MTVAVRPPAAGTAPDVPGRRSWASRTLRARLIPDPRVGRQLAAVSLLDAIGTGMYYTGSALYFVRVVGLSPGEVGAGLSIGGVVGFLGAVPVGVLADRVRAGQVYIALQLMRGLCYTALCFVTSFPLFALVAACVGLTDSAIPPIHQAVVGATVPGADRVDTLAKIRAVRNIGFGIGALVAIVSIGQNSRLAFLILIGGNALSYYVVAFLLRVIGMHRVAAHGAAHTADVAESESGPRAAGGAPAEPACAFADIWTAFADLRQALGLPARDGYPCGEHRPAHPAPVRLPDHEADQRHRHKPRLAADGRYVAAAALNGVLAVHSTVLTVAMPLWLIRYTATPPMVIGALIAANTALAVLLQARLARGCTSVSGAIRAALWAGLSLTGFAIASQLAHLATAVWLAVLLAAGGVVLLTLAELWQSASAWTIAYELADPRRRASYLSTFQVGTSVQAAVAPWLITNVLFPTPAGWLLFGVVTAAAGALVRVVLKLGPGTPAGRHRALLRRA